MKELLLTIAKGLVENPDAVAVEQDEPSEDGTIVFSFNGEEYEYDMDSEESQTTGKVVTGGSRLNVRTGAGMNYEIIDQLRPGEEVVVIGTENFLIWAGNSFTSSNEDISDRLYDKYNGDAAAYVKDLKEYAEINPAMRDYIYAALDSNLNAFDIVVPGAGVSLGIAGAIGGSNLRRS